MDNLEKGFSLDAEMAVLGSMLLGPECVAEAMLLLSEDSFYKPEHKIIFRAIVDVYVRINTVDTLLLRDTLKRMGEFQNIGGVVCIVEIMESVASAANFKYYAGIVLEKAVDREIELRANQIQAVISGNDSSKEKVVKIQEIALNLTAPAKSETSLITDHLHDAFDSLENTATVNLQTGLTSLDLQLQGLAKGSIYIVAARPSLGKTSLALSVASNIVRNGGGVVLFSMEMSKVQLTERLICGEARVSMQTARQKRLGSDEYARLTDACNNIKSNNWNLFISQQMLLTPEGLLANLRNVRRTHEIDCVMVDYIQLMSEPSVKESRQQQITAISRKLKSVAMQEDLPFVVLSQLSRQPEGRSDKRPLLSDLRDSGSLEQDADVVMFIYREDHYRRSDPEYNPNNKAEIIISKNRQGPTGTIELMFHPEYVTFEELLCRNE